MLKVDLSENGRGRGIFASRNIKKGLLIHQAPVIVLPKKEISHIKKTLLKNYVFSWGKDRKRLAVALGFGSLFNHSYTPNAYYYMKHNKETINFYSLTDILAGEEIFVNYNGDPKDDSALWFDVI